MRFHWLESERPVKAGTDVEANCGARVPGHYQFAFVDTNLGECFTLQAMKNGCRACHEKLTGKRYLYAITSGQEAMVYDS